MGTVEYKMYKEENKKPVIDLVVRKEEDIYNVEEKVNGIKLENIKKEELNEKLKDLNVSEELRLEIKKAILEKQIGIFEKKVQRIEDKNKHKEGFGKRLEEELQKLEDEVEEKFIELENKLDDVFKEI